MPTRKTIPARIKLEVRLRQKGRCGCRKACGSKLPPDGKGMVQYQHEPALALRTPLPDNSDWTPAQHDPAYLYAELTECHAAETNQGRSGATTLGSDKHAIAKTKRILGLTKQRPKKKIPGRGFDKSLTKRFDGSVVPRTPATK